MSGFVKNGDLKFFPGRPAAVQTPQAPANACKEQGCKGTMQPKGAYFVCSASEEHWTIIPSTSQAQQA